VRRLAAALLLLLAAAPAAALELDGVLTQGGLVRGHAPAGSRVLLDGKPVAVAPDGAFLLGFARDAAATATLEVIAPKASPLRQTLAVAPRKFDIQRIQGLPGAKVTPDEAALARIREEQLRINKARSANSRSDGFRQAFAWPAEGPISGVYGSQRILNGEPRSPHFGLDIAGPTGAEIRAPADGVVTLAEPDLFFTGRTLILDHGLGLTSLYAHLSASSVEVGKRVRQGEVIGRIGATGRVTGPHLHWGLFWNATPVDAQLQVPPRG
jgi:murein DD-endopeptidase MepM/ murein hydrolase activator NlpD